jgi:AcrR family transcriptional regulator
VAEYLGLRDRKKLETWRAINTAATTLFLEHGYEAVSIADIAAAANVSSSTFFNYFPTKEAVVFDSDPGDSATIRQLLDQRPEGEPLWTSLSEALQGYLATLGDRMIPQKKLKAISPTLAACGRDLADRAHEALAQWAQARHPDLPELESVLLIDLSTAAVLAAFEVWDPDSGVPVFLSMVRECLERVGTGVIP